MKINNKTIKANFVIFRCPSIGMWAFLERQTIAPKEIYCPLKLI